MVMTPDAAFERRARRRPPVVRVVGSVASWALFTASFTLLATGALQVMTANGGFCASGGPYEIADGHRCSEAVAATMPISVFGLIGAAALGVFLAGGFGLPLISWAWSILFLGLGAAFAVAGLPTGEVGFIVCAVLFIAMGVVPLWLQARVAWRELLSGTADVHGRPFAGRVGTMTYTDPHDDPQARPRRPLDVVIAWALGLGGIAAGLLLARWIWIALS